MSVQAAARRPPAKPGRQQPADELFDDAKEGDFMRPQTMLIPLSLLAILFILTAFAASNQQEPLRDRLIDKILHNGTEHTHPVFPVDDWESPPSLSLEVSVDPDGGYDLHLIVTDFLIVPENVRRIYGPDDGFIRLYVDGRHYADIYGEWYHIDGLRPGRHEFSAELVNYREEVLILAGEHVSDTVLLVVE